MSLQSKYLFAQTPNLGEFEKERNRIKAFHDYGWKEEKVTIKDLAAAGFVPSGDGTTIKDLVRCHFCGGRLWGWEHGDIPWIQHFNRYPLCPLMTGRDKSNIPLYSDYLWKAYLKRCVKPIWVITSDMSVMSLNDFFKTVRDVKPICVINRKMKLEFISSLSANDYEKADLLEAKREPSAERNREGFFPSTPRSKLLCLPESEEEYEGDDVCDCGGFNNAPSCV